MHRLQELATILFVLWLSYITIVLIGQFPELIHVKDDFPEWSPSDFAVFFSGLSNPWNETTASSIWHLENSARTVGRVSLNLRRRFWNLPSDDDVTVASKHQTPEGNKRRNHLFSLNFFGLCKEGARGLSLRKMWWKSASLLPHLRSKDLTRSLKKLGFTWCVDKQGRLIGLLLPFTIFFLLGVSFIHLGIR